MNRHNLSTFNFRKEIIAFTLKCILLLMILFFFCFIIVMPQYSYGFNASIIDKNNRAKEIKEPKILLIGNSNLVFGMNSKDLEEAVGMPVVNMGLHAGLGNAFLDNMAKYYVNEGDLVIFCHTEYEDDDKILNEQLAWLTIENHLSLWKLIRLKDMPGMVKAYPTYLKDSIKLWLAGEGNKKTGEAYTREYFNEYGDNIFLRDEQQMEFSEGQIAIPTINDACINRLNQLNTYISDHGAKMLITAYPIVGCQYTPSDSEYIKLQSELDERLDCEIISEFTNYIIDETYFFDSAFHLNDAGVNIRTQKLIEDIKKYQIIN